MELIPAMDLYGGNVVRLKHGKLENKIEFGSPSKFVEQFRKCGARRLHVVDLEAAIEGSLSHGPILASIIDLAGDMEVQIGGGIRTESRIVDLLDLGAHSVVVSTMAIKDPNFFMSLVVKYPSRIALAVDVKDGFVRCSGWIEGTLVSPTEFINRFKEVELSLSSIIVTDISRDGTLEGPCLSLIEKVLAITSAPLIVSGGIESLEDLEKLADLEINGQKIFGAICGMAIYSGKLDLSKAIELCKRSE